MAGLKIFIINWNYLNILLCSYIKYGLHCYVIIAMPVES